MRNFFFIKRSNVSDKDLTHSLVMQPLTVLLIVIGFFFTVSLCSLFYIAGDLNTRSDIHRQILITKALENRLDSMRTHLTDNAFWGEAYENLHRSINIDWAWGAQNLGDSMYKTFGYEGVFVLNSSGKTGYSVINGQIDPRSLESWLGANPINRLRAQLENSENGAISLYVISENEVTLLAAAEIGLGGDKTVELVPGPASIMVFADRLTPEKLEAMGLEYDIKHLRIKAISDRKLPVSEQEMLLPLSNGRVSLTWQSANPGGALLTPLLPLLVLLMLGTFILVYMLSKKSLRRARVLDESNFLLAKSQEALCLSERRFRDVAETTSDWIWEADENLKFTWLSDRFPAITGWHTDDWLNRSVTEFLLNNPQVASKMKNLTESEAPVRITGCPFISGQGQERFCALVVKRVNATNNQAYYRGTATDITLEIEAQERVRYLSYHDELTGLPNRVRMKEFLEGRLKDTLTDQKSLAMIMIDLDNFKPVNDLYGHAAGDKLLYDLSFRLRKCLYERGLIARLGGDEFIIILPDVGSEEEIVSLCSLIIKELNYSFDIYGNTVNVGASLGIAVAPKDAETPEDLMRFADIALYNAKNDGRNKWVFYRHDMGEKIIQRREMENELRRAIQEGQLRLVYQPRYDVKASRITAVEALVRWDHPERGTIMPDQFIPIAEETGLIIPLSNWVLMNACQDTVHNFADLAVSVNISPAEFQDSSLLQRIVNALEFSGLDSSRLVIEITENALLNGPDRILSIMKDIRKLGVKFLIDDFGTGYASLNYLRTFPFDGIKIDKSLIIPMGKSADELSIVENMIGLGKAYSLGISAEGVESQAQLEQLKRFECDNLQGYFIGKPMPSSELKALLIQTLNPNEM